jgi:nicotinamidase-related amidase
MKSQTKPTAGKEQHGIALLIIDVQQGLFDKSTPIFKADELLQNLHTLAERARKQRVPVFYIQHSDKHGLEKGTPGWQLHPQLQVEKGDSLIYKEHGNSFEDTPLDAELKSRNINTVVVSGLVTHGCVRATCLGALELEYRVILAKDAHSSYSAQAAERIVEWNDKLSKAGVELKSTQNVDFASK